MPEVTIASHKWRKRTRDWSAVCDNTLKLDRSYGLVGNPSMLNEIGVCAPDCEICVTPFSRNLNQPGCYCKTVPYIYEVTFPTPVQGTHPEWSACFSVSSGQARFYSALNNTAKNCSWQGPTAPKKVCHASTGVFVPAPGPGWIYNCLSLSSISTVLSYTHGPAFTLGFGQKTGSATLGIMNVALTTDWGFQNGSTIGLTWTWRGDIDKCFGEFTLPFVPASSTMTWPVDPRFPAAGTYSLPSFFSYPSTVKVKSFQQ